MRSFSLAVAVAALSLFAAEARAQWGMTLATEDGVEIGVDGRVFTLFAMLNGLGFDEDSVRGPAPLHRPLYAPGRVKARQNLGRPGPALKALDAVLAKNPLPRSAYVAAALELGAAPNFDDKGAGPLAKAIAQPMRDWFNEEGGAGVLKIVAEEAKAQQKKLLPILDSNVKKTFALIRLGDASDQLLDDTGAQGRVSVVLNDLDSHGGIQRVQRGDMTYLVMGPPASEEDEKLLVHAVVAAVGRTLVVREAGKVKAGSLVDVAKLGANAKKSVADEKAYATELLSCAFMRQVRGADAACVGSPLEGDPAASEALSVLAPRVDAFSKDTAVLSASVDKLLEAPPPPPPPEPTAPVEPVKEEPKGKGKGKKGKGG